SKPLSARRGGPPGIRRPDLTGSRYIFPSHVVLVYKEPTRNKGFFGVQSTHFRTVRQKKPEKPTPPSFTWLSRARPAPSACRARSASPSKPALLVQSRPRSARDPL